MQENPIMSPPTSSSAPLPQSMPSNVTLVPTSSKKNALYALVVLQFIVILAVAGALGYVYFKNSNGQPISTTGEESVQPTKDDQKQQSMVRTFFLRDMDIWASFPDGKEQMLTKTNGNVLSFRTSKDNTRIVYIVGVNETQYPEAINIRPYQVIYAEVAQGVLVPSEIFSLKEKTFENAEYGLKIWDATISEDGKTVIYSTSDSVYLYDTMTKESKTVFSAPISDPSGRKGLIYNYTHHQLSPDGQKILLRRGYYEGFDRVVLDIPTGKLYELPITANGYGSNAEVLWLSNTQLSVYETMDAAVPQGYTTRYYTLDWTGGEKLNVKDMHDYYPDHAVITADRKTVYGVDSKYVVTKTYDDGRQDFDVYAIGIRINVETGQVTELFTQKLENNQQAYSNIRLSADESSLYLEFTKYEDTSVRKIYSLDLVSPNAQPVEVTGNGAFNLRV